MDHLNEELQGVADRLARLAPIGTVDRDAAIYQAGLAAGRRAGRPWRASTAVLGVCLAAAIVVPAMIGPAGRQTPSGQSLVADRPAAELPTESPPPLSAAEESAVRARTEYLALRQRVLQTGLDALPAHRPRSPQPATQLRDLLLGNGRPSATDHLGGEA